MTLKTPESELRRLTNSTRIKRKRNRSQTKELPMITVHGNHRSVSNVKCLQIITIKQNGSIELINNAENAEIGKKYQRSRRRRKLQQGRNEIYYQLSQQQSIVINKLQSQIVSQN